MDINFTFLEALIVGVIYWLAWNEIDVFIPVHTRFFRDPVGSALVLGLIFGNMELGLAIGGTVGLVYIGVSTIGANLPSDQALSVCAAVPIAIKLGLSVEEAMLIAVPFGLLGSVVDTTRRVIQGYWNRLSLKYIEEKAFDKLHFSAAIGPALVVLAIRIIPLTLLLWLFGGIR